MRNFPFKLFLVFAIAAIFLAGCISKPCSPGYLTPAFIGFAPSDLDTIVLRGYKADGTFSQLVDTTIYTKYYWLVNPPQSDTTVIQTPNFIPLNGIIQLSAGYDWQIYIPAVKKIVSISHMTFDQTYKTAFFLNDIWGCIAPVTSYVQDGQSMPVQITKLGPYPTANGGYQSYAGFLIFIHK